MKMPFPKTLMFASLLFLWSNIACAQRPFLRRSSLEDVTIEVGDRSREYLIHVPDDLSQKVPLVFGFHGHGGSARQASRSFHLEEEWPEAIVVYMQGIPTPGRLTDPDGKRNGWQHGAGAEEDRDLKFFDAVLKQIKEKYPVDDQRIFSMGHSNGGAFTYLLWAERPDVFAAVAPSAATAGREVRKLKPKRVMHLAGTEDTLVKFAWQELMIQRLFTINHSSTDGNNWCEYGTLYPSKSGHDVLTYIHPGTHKFPEAGPALIVKFFKESPSNTREESPGE